MTVNDRKQPLHAKLLIIDDEQNFLLPLREYLQREGFIVATYDNGTAALSAFDTFQPDLVILDVELPDRTGVEICRELRQRVNYTVGIIMISGVRKEELDQVTGLEEGADVYLTKPVQMPKLVAQIGSLLRRMEAQNSHTHSDGWFVVDKYLRIHFEQRRVECDGKEVHLAPMQFDVLKYLVEHYDKACTRTALVEAVHIADNTVNTCISKLREKIDRPSHTSYILAIHGVGYRFKAPKE